MLHGANPPCAHALNQSDLLVLCHWTPGESFLSLLHLRTPQLGGATKLQAFQNLLSSWGKQETRNVEPQNLEMFQVFSKQGTKVLTGDQ